MKLPSAESPLRAGGAQDTRWRGRSLHCTGRHPAAGSGRLQGGWRAGCSRRRPGWPPHGPGRHPAVGLCWRSVGDTCAFCRRWSPFVRGLPPGSRLWQAEGRLREASGYRHGSHTALHVHHDPHGGAHHQPCSGRWHTRGISVRHLNQLIQMHCLLYVT